MKILSCNTKIIDLVGHYYKKKQLSPVFINEQAISNLMLSIGQEILFIMQTKSCRATVSAVLNTDVQSRYQIKD